MPLFFRNESADLRSEGQMCPVRRTELWRLLGSVLGAGTKQFDHGFAEGFANRAERLGTAQVVISSIGGNFVPFVLAILLLEHRVGLAVPEGVRFHQLHVALELRKSRGGSLGDSEIPVIRSRLYAIGIDTQLADNERKIGRLEVASHVANEICQLLLVEWIGFEHVIPS